MSENAVIPDTYGLRRKPMRISRRELIAGVIAGCVLAVAAQVILPRLSDHVEPDARVRRLARRLTTRPIIARLTGLAFAPAPQHYRGSKIARASTVPAIEGQRTGSAAAAFADGMTLVMSGRVSEAVALMATAARGNPRYANDLAAVLFETGRSNEDPDSLIRALVAADAAIDADPMRPEPHFNRALILESLGLRDAAVRAFEMCRDLETDSSWLAETRERLTRLQRQATVADEWLGQLPRLRAAADRGDDATVAAIATRFPQQARTWAEGIFLCEWADAFQRGRFNDAHRALELTFRVGKALQAANADCFLTAVVWAIRRATPPEQAIVAHAQQTYRAGRQEYAARRVAEALPLLRQARDAYQIANSPMAFTAAHFYHAALYDSGDAVEALDRSRRLLADLPPCYRGRRAEILWLSATISGNTESMYSSLQGYREAEQLFTDLGEREFAAQMTDFGSQVLTHLGRDLAASRQRIVAFRTASDAGNLTLIESMLTQAASDGAHTEQWSVAASFLKVALERTGKPSNLRRRVQNLLNRAITYWRLGDVARSTNDLARARIAASALDPHLGESAIHDIDVAEAIITEGREPRRAFDDLSRAISFASEQGKRTQMPRLFLQRARAARLLGRLSEASDDLERAVTMIEEDRRAIGAEDLRDTFFGSVLAAYDELIDLRDSQGENDSAFDAAERERARLIADRIGGGSAEMMHFASRDDVASSLPQGTVLLHYTSLVDRLVINAIDDASMEVRHVDIAREALRRRIDTLHSSISMTAGAKGLFEALLAPVAPMISRAERLVIVGDDATTGVPFAMLVDSDGRSVLERWSITVVPSATIYVQMRQNRRKRPAGDVLIVGDPAFDTTRYPGFSRLEGARNEADEIGRLYGVRPLLGVDATVAAVQQRVAGVHVLHIAAHAVINTREPHRSALLFADAEFSISEIASLRLLIPLSFSPAAGPPCETGATTCRVSHMRF